MERLKRINIKITNVLGKPLPQNIEPLRIENQEALNIIADALDAETAYLEARIDEIFGPDDDDQE